VVAIPPTEVLCVQRGGRRGGTRGGIRRRDRHAWRHVRPAGTSSLPHLRRRSASSKGAQGREVSLEAPGIPLHGCLDLTHVSRWQDHPHPDPPQHLPFPANVPRERSL